MKMKLGAISRLAVYQAWCKYIYGAVSDHFISYVNYKLHDQVFEIISSSIIK